MPLWSPNHGSHRGGSSKNACRPGPNSDNASSVGSGSYLGGIPESEDGNASINNFGGTSVASMSAYGKDDTKQSGRGNQSLGGAASEIMSTGMQRNGSNDSNPASADNRSRNDNVSAQSTYELAPERPERLTPVDNGARPVGNNAGYDERSQQYGNGRASGNQSSQSNQNSGNQGNQSNQNSSNQSYNENDFTNKSSMQPQAQDGQSQSGSIGARQENMSGGGAQSGGNFGGVQDDHFTQIENTSSNEVFTAHQERSHSQGGHSAQPRGTGYIASAYEHTDSVSIIPGQDGDPVAQAGDFAREDADVVFVSKQMGSGPTRQPMTRFRVHSVNLNVHSGVLSELVDDDNPEQEIILEEDAATLKVMFGLMYNRPSPTLTMTDWQVVLRLARAAQKYDFARGKEVAAAYFTEQEQLGALSPFMTYAFAVQYKLYALEETAAERSVKYDIHSLPELIFNMMGFAAYQKLRTFHQSRQTHYQDVLNAITMNPKELADQCYQTGGVCVISPWNKLKNKLAWPRQAGRDGSKKPPEPTDVLRKVGSEIGQIDCGTCSKALVEGALQAQLALESMPPYVDEEDSF